MDPEQRGFWRAPYNDGLNPAVGETITVLNQRIISIEEKHSNIDAKIDDLFAIVKTMIEKIDKLAEKQQQGDT